MMDEDRWTLIAKGHLSDLGDLKTYTKQIVYRTLDDFHNWRFILEIKIPWNPFIYSNTSPGVVYIKKRL